MNFKNLGNMGIGYAVGFLEVIGELVDLFGRLITICPYMGIFFYYRGFSVPIFFIYECMKVTNAFVVCGKRATCWYAHQGIGSHLIKLIFCIDTHMNTYQ